MKYLVIYHMVENNTLHHRFKDIDEVLTFIRINPNIKWYKVLDDDTGEEISLRSPGDITCICGERVHFDLPIPNRKRVAKIYRCQCGRKFMPDLRGFLAGPVMLISDEGNEYWSEYS